MVHHHRWMVLGFARASLSDCLLISDHYSELHQQQQQQHLCVKGDESYVLLQLLDTTNYKQIN